MALSFSMAWSALPAPMQAALTSGGWHCAGALASLDDLPPGDVVVEFEAMLGRGAGAEEAMAVLDLVAAAGPEAKRLRRSFVLANDMTF